MILEVRRDIQRNRKHHITVSITASVSLFDSSDVMRVSCLPAAAQICLTQQLHEQTKTINYTSGPHGNEMFA